MRTSPDSVRMISMKESFRIPGCRVEQKGEQKSRNRRCHLFSGVCLWWGRKKGVDGGLGFGVSCVCLRWKPVCIFTWQKVKKQRKEDNRKDSVKRTTKLSHFPQYLLQSFLLWLPTPNSATIVSSWQRSIISHRLKASDGSTQTFCVHAHGFLLFQSTEGFSPFHLELSPYSLLPHPFPLYFNFVPPG